MHTKTRSRSSHRTAADRPVANLPYNVAVPVVLHLLATLPTLRTGLVMVQKEVADRLTAKPGNRTYGIPSVKLAWYADARPAGRVPPNVFWPVPNVDSGLVAFTRREPPRTDVPRTDVFAVVDAAFSQRRKTLRAALAGWAGADAAASVPRPPGSTATSGEHSRAPSRRMPQRQAVLALRVGEPVTGASLGRKRGSGGDEAPGWERRDRSRYGSAKITFTPAWAGPARRLPRAEHSYNAIGL